MRSVENPNFGAESKKTHYAYEEYLALEQSDNIRYEYYNGEVFAMAGGTQAHNIISQNFILLLTQLLSSECISFIGDIKVEIQSKYHYLYPDVVVTCDPADIAQEKTSISAPTLVIEVLSKSTQYVDKDAKKQSYMRLPTLEYYMLVAQDKVVIELYSRHKDFWTYKTYDDPMQVIELPKLHLSLKVSDIYRRIKFDQTK